LIERMSTKARLTTQNITTMLLNARRRRKESIGMANDECRMTNAPPAVEEE
jgi:hypothetical protein